MDKAAFLTVMRFPPEWLTLEMYPDELFASQFAMYQPGDERGAEHDRNGAFHWWLRRQPTKAELRKLLLLASLDPDAAMGQDVRGYLRRSRAFDAGLAAYDAALKTARQ
jgi:hypothetical protein